MIKKTLLITPCLLLLLGFGACQKQAGNESTSTDKARQTGGDGSTNGYPKRYLVESGIIEYEITGPQTGTETVYFDKWGWREAKYTNTSLSIAGITRKENKLSLMDGDWIYHIDLERRTGTKIKNTMLPQFVEAARRKDQSMTELGEKMLADMGGKKIGAEQVAGKSCDVWEIKNLGSKSWVWQGVTLRTQVNMGGLQITSAARSFVDNTAVPTDKFAIPGDVKITESQDVKRVLEGISDKPKPPL